jgi:hypothetical protein
VPVPGEIMSIFPASVGNEGHIVDLKPLDHSTQLVIQMARRTASSAGMARGSCCAASRKAGSRRGTSARLRHLAARFRRRPRRAAPHHGRRAGRLLGRRGRAPDRAQQELARTPGVRPLYIRSASGFACCGARHRAARVPSRSLHTFGAGSDPGSARASAGLRAWPARGGA